jgi:nucleotide-binding universal stress UspA family protein
MRTVLAALDAGAAARPVLDIAIGFAELTGATVEAVHVTDGATDTPEWLAAQNEITLRLLEGAVEPALLRAVEDEAVIAAVFGARSTPTGRRPTGRTARHILERATKPVVVVPPDVSASAKSCRRLLVPLEGDEATSRPVLERLWPLIDVEVELVVLHVFTSATVPRMLDRPSRDLSSWGDEFVARFCPGASSIELRTGAIGAQVAEVAAEARSDLVVLSWSRDSSPGHAKVIRDVLSGSSIPVLLLPVDAAGG